MYWRWSLYGESKALSINVGLKSLHRQDSFLTSQLLYKLLYSALIQLFFLLYLRASKSFKETKD